MQTPHFPRRAILAGATAALMTARATSATPLRLRCRFADQDFTWRLHDNPTTRDLISLLPLDLMIEDFSTNEKIAHLPRRLDEGGLVDYDDEQPGDLCYFRGWGNLAMFHGSYRYRGDLIRLGHIEGGVAPLLVKGSFPLNIALA
ncbi:MAG: cyclophilin-like fold protein [Paracoccus sp. (in: a-proteobacteria)]|uniref:cyclophilin-like fold protein n=1 Tax=Paracoccus sp. TaxID=267 RepID=UPI0026E03BAB|nr:cyclophilin-like fold protein [Paracoccus sp. (in: a-proteobacteria)]MDO5620278.1 cyclophilin-like fold protein [Paracoccus sp. (in: a-proteobacteria)]